MSELREAAQAVVAQWDTPNWKLTVHTGVLIDRFRAALAQPEAEAPIAAKCQRVEGSGEICGLTPPCPDCGSSLIDVPEGE